MPRSKAAPTLFCDPEYGDTLFFEKSLWEHGHRYVAGCDEVGRGPLAGPVVAAAVILPPGIALPGVTDSKKLSEARRWKLVPGILAAADCVAIGFCDQAEIDRINILQASKTAMMRALAGLSLLATHVLVDGNQRLPITIPQTPLVKGDLRSLSIAAASIVAKVVRDELMCAMHARWPEYGFDRNRGYPSAEHRDALRLHGPCPIHRRSYQPVAEVLA
ncbi:MAG: ribonuclease HII [Deltaproteobacteria bacterium]|nr:ribonuclease HII [Deltaproteobacteria bacterium]